MLLLHRVAVHHNQHLYILLFFRHGWEKNYYSNLVDTILNLIACVL